MGTAIVEQYLELGLRVGRHIEGFVDAYYGPAELARRVATEPLLSPAALRADARRLVAALDAHEPLGTGDDSPHRRHYLRAQVIGLEMTTRVLAGESVPYADEVEACYGVRPHRPDPEEFRAAHAGLDAVVPGSGQLAERLVAWRESHAVAPDVLERCLASLADDFRERTAAAFGLPDGEAVDFELVTGAPWSGFNYYLGGLRSRVAINTDLPVLSTAVAHLVAHEAYPGHHTEHVRKEVGLVGARHLLEESIFLVGTPQCLVSEGLADFGLEALLGRRPEAMIAAHLHPLGVRYDADVVAVVAEAAESLAQVRAYAAFRLHEDGVDPGDVVAEVARFSLTTTARAEKSVEFLLDPTWRAYISCYVEGLPLVRSFVAGDVSRFARLITDQVVPDDLAVHLGS